MHKGMERGAHSAEVHPKRISFTKEDPMYGFLSNFTKRPIIVDGLVYATTEHYFQCRKFVDPAYAEYIRVECATPAQAKAAGAERSVPIRADWRTARLSIMLTALRAKFSQHDDLRERLLSTVGSELVEHSRSDKFWGDGGGAPGAGENALGQLLMQVRSEMQATRSSQATAPPPTPNTVSSATREGRGADAGTSSASSGGDTKAKKAKNRLQ